MSSSGPEISQVPLSLDMVHVLANRISRTLIPIVALVRLFSGEYIDEATCIRIKLVGFLDVSVERSGIELRENEDLIKARIEAVTDRDINQAILARERHSRLTAIPRQRTESRPATTAHYDADYFSFFHRSR